jgi:hypothetical protein
LRKRDGDKDGDEEKLHAEVKDCQPAAAAKMERDFPLACSLYQSSQEHALTCILQASLWSTLQETAKLALEKVEQINNMDALVDDRQRAAAGLPTHAADSSQPPSQPPSPSNRNAVVHSDRLPPSFAFNSRWVWVGAKRAGF